MAALRRGKRYELTEDLNQWAGRLIRRFRMKVSPPPVVFGRLDGANGVYRCGTGLFGFWDEIVLDEDYVAEAEDWRVLRTETHEAAHGWQRQHGRPPSDEEIRLYQYHNAEFRRKVESLGLIVDSEGCTSCKAGNTPFLNLLRERGIHVPHRLRVPGRLREQPLGVKTADAPSSPLGLTDDLLNTINDILTSAGFTPLELPNSPKTPPLKLGIPAIENLLEPRTSFAQNTDWFRWLTKMSIEAWKNPGIWPNRKGSGWARLAAAAAQIVKENPL